MFFMFWGFVLYDFIILGIQISNFLDIEASSFHRKNINFFRDGLASSFLSEISGPAFPSELLVPPSLNLSQSTPPHDLF